MKKIIAIILTILACVLIFSSCGNYGLVDTNYKFDKAIISMPDGTILELDIDKWYDYDGEQLQIVAEDGTIYLVSSFNCVLINDKG